MTGVRLPANASPRHLLSVANSDLTRRFMFASLERLPAPQCETWGYGSPATVPAELRGDVYLQIQSRQFSFMGEEVTI
jgi:hypothetical protein